MTTYGRWTLVGEPWRENGPAKARAVCGGCNVEHVVRMDNLKRGRSLSCAKCTRRGPKTEVRASQKMTFGGVTKQLQEWCSDHGTSVCSYRERVRKGMDPWEAITTLHPGKPHNHGVGAVECIVVQPSMACSDTAVVLDRIGMAVGVAKQRAEQIAKLALVRAQFAEMSRMVVAPLLNERPDDYLADLLAFAIEDQAERRRRGECSWGWGLSNGDLTLEDLEDHFEDSKKRPTNRTSGENRSVA